MNRVLVIIGAVVVAIGLFLLALFPGLFYVPANSINSSNFNDGDKVTVYGTITKLVYENLINNTFVELDSNLTIIFSGHLKNYNVGEEVFVTIKKVNLIHLGEWKASVWESTQGDIHLINAIREYFYIVSFIGVSLVVIGILLRR